MILQITSNYDAKENKIRLSLAHNASSIDQATSYAIRKLQSNLIEHCMPEAGIMLPVDIKTGDFANIHLLSIAGENQNAIDAIKKKTLIDNFLAKTGLRDGIECTAGTVYNLIEEFEKLKSRPPVPPPRRPKEQQQSMQTQLPLTSTRRSAPFMPEHRNTILEIKEYKFDGPSSQDVLKNIVEQINNISDPRVLKEAVALLEKKLPPKAQLKFVEDRSQIDILTNLIERINLKLDPAPEPTQPKM